MGCNPLNHGFDIVIESGTKYLSGHSDNFLGIITTKSKIFYKQIKKQPLDMETLFHQKVAFPH